MGRVQFIRHGGRDILFLDFSKCSIAEALAVIDESAAVIRSTPEDSLLTLTDVTGVSYDYSLSQKMKEFTTLNKPHVRAAAVIGVAGLKKILFDAIMIFSKRNLQAFDDMEKAKDWLTTN